MIGIEYLHPVWSQIGPTLRIYQSHSVAAASQPRDHMEIKQFFHDSLCHGRSRAVQITVTQDTT
jgi:hypothetical protein